MKERARISTPQPPPSTQNAHLSFALPNIPKCFVECFPGFFTFVKLDDTLVSMSIIFTFNLRLEMLQNPFRCFSLSFTVCSAVSSLSRSVDRSIDRLVSPCIWKAHCCLCRDPPSRPHRAPDRITRITSWSSIRETATSSCCSSSKSMKQRLGVTASTQDLCW